MGDWKLSEEIGRTKRQAEPTGRWRIGITLLVRWIAKAEALEQEIAELRLHCWEGDVESDVEANP